MKTLIFSLVLTTFLLGCAANKSKKNERESTTPLSEISLAPGYISTKLEILKIEDSNKVTAKVIEVLSYGSATDPLPTGTELVFMMTEKYSKEVSNKIKVGNLIQTILSSGSSGMMMDESNKQKTWKLISIK